LAASEREKGDAKEALILEINEERR